MSEFLNADDNKAGEEFLKGIKNDMRTSTSDEWVEFSEHYGNHLGALITVTAGLVLAAQSEEGVKIIPALEKKIAERYDGDMNVPRVLADFGTIMMAMATSWAESCGLDAGQAFLEFMRIAEQNAREFVSDRSSDIAHKKIFGGMMPM